MEIHIKLLPQRYQITDYIHAKSTISHGDRPHGRSSPDYYFSLTYPIVARERIKSKQCKIQNILSRTHQHFGAQRVKHGGWLISDDECNSKRAPQQSQAGYPGSWTGRQCARPPWRRASPASPPARTCSLRGLRERASCAVTHTHHGTLGRASPMLPA